MRNFLTKKSFLAVSAASVVTSIAVIGCGGGGGSSAVLSFPDAVIATATDENATVAVQTVLSSIAYVPSPEIVDPSQLFAVADTNTTLLTLNPIPIVMDEFKKISFDKFSTTNTLNETVSDSGTVDCTGGGTTTLSYSLTLDESSLKLTGWTAISAEQCTEEDVTLDGSMKITLECQMAESADPALLYEVVSCESMNMSIGSDGLSVITTLEPGSYSMAPYSTFNLANVVMADDLWQTQMTLNYIITETESGNQYGMNNFVIDYQDISLEQFSEDFRSGRVYFNNLANYVDVDTTYEGREAFIYDLTNSQFISGSNQFNAANDSKIRFYIESNEVKIAITQP